ncbi:MAG TPA: SDR family oxidoreductase [Solirubrobacteraceae bacterium]|jgi:3-oxoacyl-[acyl-carrier protein] reductase|nr:SDR family oxidoreductase [Solirubrobacteraceae bacterium]
MELGLRDRACIVTGASRGIGRATAVTLASEGASVLLVGRREDALAEVQQQCSDAGGRAFVTATDITDPGAGERIAAACVDAFARIDVLVNNAGTSRVASLEQLTDEDWQSQWELNVLAPMRLMRACVPVMAEAGWGRIVNISSSSGKRPGQRNVAYSVTKAAELSLSRAYADAYAKRGVLINAITPGPVGTELWLGDDGLAEQSAAARGGTRADVLASVAAGVPLGRLGEPQEIANAIVFLCSEAASNVTGAAWSVDGGIVPGII